MFRSNEPQGKWYRMDNSADIYPMSSTMTTMSIFRLSAEMEDYVDGDNLQAALADILPRFPTFAVQLRKGFLRYYFDANELEPRVFPDNGILFQKIDSLKNNRYLFRVQYYKKRISVDFFHGLCDGTGAMEFLKALVYRYLDECGETLPPKGSVKVAGEPVKESETEDSISRYYTQYKLTGGVVGKIYVKDGDAVKAGDPLIEINNVRLSSEIEIVKNDLLQNSVLVSRLQAQRDDASSVEYDPEVKEFAGFSKNVHDEIIDATVFVLPSNYEGLSNSMLEAMAIGLPVICTDCPPGGAREYIQDYSNGILVRVGDAEGVCKALNYIVENRRQAEMISKNAEKIAALV